MSESNTKTFDQPDWQTQSADVHCPLCNYNLRGLAEPRCPECGYQFTWPELLDPARRRHAYLFELHQESNFKSFWKTAFHSLRPRKFWLTLRADQPSVPRRLFLYWAISAFVTLAAITSEYAMHVFVTNDDRLRGIRSVFGANTPHFPLDWALETVLPTLAMGAVVLMWPWITFLSLLVFRKSMRRARVMRIHVARCVVYCSDIALWVGIAEIITNVVRVSTYLWSVLVPTPSGSAGTPAGYYSPRYDVDTWNPFPFWFWVVAGVIFMFRLMDAYGRYLRFRHVVVTILLTQVIVVLFFMAMIYYGNQIVHFEYQTGRIVFEFRP